MDKEFLNVFANYYIPFGICAKVLNEKKKNLNKLYIKQENTTGIVVYKTE